MENKIVSFSAKFGTPKIINSQFHKVKIYVAYTGKNRNMSYIGKDTLEKMIPSLYGVPIVGEWKGEDFGSHGGKIEISEDGIEIIDTTKPYGFIDSSAEISWELVKEDDGVENEYLVTYGYLWTGRYPEALKVLSGDNNQSMEINVFDGYVFDDGDNKGYFNITDAEFSTLCIIGENVVPCFESAHISQFSMSPSTKSFKKELLLMVGELKKYEDENGASELKLNKEVQFMENKAFATYRQKYDALSDAMPYVEKKDDNGELLQRIDVSVSDFDDTYVYVSRWIYSSEDGYRDEIGRYAYSFDKDTMKAELTSDFEEMVRAWLTLEENKNLQEERAAFTQVTAKLEDLTREFDKAKESLFELEDLKKYKAQVENEIIKSEKMSLLAKYDEHIGDSEEYNKLKEDIDKFSAIELEKRFALILVADKIKFSKVEKKVSKIAKIDFEKEIVSEKCPYGNLFDSK